MQNQMENSPWQKVAQKWQLCSIRRPCFHRVLQGAARKGATILLHVAVLQTILHAELSVLCLETSYTGEGVVVSNGGFPDLSFCVSHTVSLPNLRVAHSQSPKSETP